MLNINLYSFHIQNLKGPPDRHMSCPMPSIAVRTFFQARVRALHILSRHKSRKIKSSQIQLDFLIVLPLINLWCILLIFLWLQAMEILHQKKYEC